MTPALVILAAGLGRRFGGDKQLAGVGAAGRPLMAYAVHDAFEAGFGRVVAVIRPGMERAVREALAGMPLPLDCVEQQSDRARPWGTGHAVLAAAAVVDTPFMVINADDFYGADAYRLIAAFLPASGAAPPAFALAAYPLGATLSPHGPVNRGICRVDEAGQLIAINEVAGLTADSGWPADTPVSMNCWGFTPALFPMLVERFVAFRRVVGDSPDAEFMLPEAIGGLVATRQASVQVLRAPGPWLGVTFPADRDLVSSQLARWVGEGRYPATW